MGLLTSRLSQLRSDPRLLRFPPYLALLCMLGGIIWMLLLPLDEYSRRTYVSENALLPGQVHTYFEGSEQNIFRAYRHEVANVLEPKSVDDDQGQPTGQYLMATEEHRNQILEGIFRNAGLKTARQAYSYHSAGKTYKGENVYAIVHGPRADGTESIVLVAPIRNIEDQINTNGVTLLLTLARYFSRWSLWSKDIIVLITPDTAAGPQAWIDAYHAMHDSTEVADLRLKSGHIQGAVVIDYPFEHRFETLHVAYDGINGQLPNLDLINTAISIASGQMGIGTTIQNQHTYTSPNDQGEYLVRLKTLIRGMGSQALGHSTGAHSVFMPYHIDAITLTAVGQGWQDEMAFGRVVESTTRSLNNLLEKLHQSFFFYLLLQNTNFVSIGTYLPSAMAVGAGFTIVAIWLWIMGGYQELEAEEVKDDEKVISSEDKPTQSKVVDGAVVRSSLPDRPQPTKTQWKAIDRPLIMPIAIIATVQFTTISMIFFPSAFETTSTFQLRCLTMLILLACVSYLPFNLGLSRYSPDPAVRTQFYGILSSLSLLILGLELTVLATLNFSLSMFLGLVCSPLAFVSYIPTSEAKINSKKPTSRSPLLPLIQKTISILILSIMSPPVLIFIVAAVDIYYISPFRAPIGIFGRIREYLDTEAFAFDVWSSWGSLVGVWAIWAPAWVVGMMIAIRSFVLVQSAQKDTPTRTDPVGKTRAIGKETR